MLRYFLEAPLKKESNVAGENDPEQLKKKKDFFKDKKLLLEHPEMIDHLWKYTVLSLSLSGFEMKSEEGFKELFNETIAALFHRFSEVLPFLTTEEGKKFKKYLEGTRSLENFLNHFPCFRRFSLVFTNVPFFYSLMNMMQLLIPFGRKL